MNFRQFLKDIHATFFLFLVGDETKPEKTTEKSQNGENGKHNLGYFIIILEDKTIESLLTTRYFSNSIQEYILPAVFIILWKPKSETEKNECFRVLQYDVCYIFIRLG